MRRRVVLIMMLASLLTMSGCGLSDQQQIGILRFVASSITGAIAAPAPVAKQAKQTTTVKPCSQHRLQHMHSRIQYAKSRMQRVMTRVIHFQMFTAERTVCRTRTVVARRS